MPCSLHIGRCVAALLLPLLMRTANQAEIISIFFVVAAAWLLAQSGRKSLYRNFIIPIFAVTSWSYLAAHIADFVVVGEFRRLLLTYAIAFDGMSDMLPEWVAPDIKVSGPSQPHSAMRLLTFSQAPARRRVLL